jgi:hypothetical protein
VPEVQEVHELGLELEQVLQGLVQATHSPLEAALGLLRKNLQIIRTGAQTLVEVALRVLHVVERALGAVVGDLRAGEAAGLALHAGALVHDQLRVRNRAGGQAPRVVKRELFFIFVKIH